MEWSVYTDVGCYLSWSHHLAAVKCVVLFSATAMTGIVAATSSNSSGKATGSGLYGLSRDCSGMWNFIGGAENVGRYVDIVPACAADPIRSSQASEHVWGCRPLDHVVTTPMGTPLRREGCRFTEGIRVAICNVFRVLNSRLAFVPGTLSAARFGAHSCCAWGFCTSWIRVYFPSICSPLVHRYLAVTLQSKRCWGRRRASRKSAVPFCFVYFFIPRVLSTVSWFSPNHHRISRRRCDKAVLCDQRTGDYIFGPQWEVLFLWLCVFVFAFVEVYLLP